jgi:hypothetical protein
MIFHKSGNVKNVPHGPLVRLIYEECSITKRSLSAKEEDSVSWIKRFRFGSL